MPETFVTITEHGCYRYRPERILSADGMLDQIGSRRSFPPVVVNDLIPATDARPAVSIIVSPTNLVFGCKLPSLTFNTWFAPSINPDDGTAFVTPVWRDTPVAVPQIREWTPPSPFEIHFFFTPADALAYLVFRDTDTGSTYRPPIGNIFNDTRICMGNSWGLPSIASLSRIAAFDLALDYFKRGQGNMDLNTSAVNTCSLESFRWSPEDHGAQIPRPLHAAHMERASHHVWDGFFAATSTGGSQI